MKTSPMVSRYVHGQFSWVDRVAHDITAVAPFYADLFGWTVERQDPEGGPPYALFTLDGKAVAGIGEMTSAMREHGAPPVWNSYIRVDDVEATAKTAEALGAQIITPPMQILDAGWLALIADPTGAAVGLWQGGTRHGAERAGVPGTFCWNELNTRDLDRATDFFGKLFGWTYADNPDAPAPYAIIQHDGRDSGGILQMTEAWGDMPPHWVVYFAIEAIEVSVERLQALGGRLHYGPFDTAAGQTAVVADPEGATFHLIERHNSTA